MLSPQLPNHPFPSGPPKAIQITIVIVVALAIAAFFIGLSLTEHPHRIGSNATLNITIYSSSPPGSATYGLYIEDSLVGFGTINHSSYIQGDYYYHWPSYDQTVVHVSVKSLADPFGIRFNYANVTVSNDGTYGVNITI